MTRCVRSFNPLQATLSGENSSAFNFVLLTSLGENLSQNIVTFPQ